MTTYVAKRVYDEAKNTDGYRVLIDRLWPRGVSKERAKLDQWARVLAPSDELRKWFNHDPAKYSAFAKKYIEELEINNDLQTYLQEWSNHRLVTLLYGAKDNEHNEVMVLIKYLRSKIKK